ncbi:MAG: sigma 54-interacting transcriptional regulator, partial [Rhizobacter sp.]
CASLPETLIESELFGYRAGAFTGAQRAGRRGKILQADGGTLFLDEIADMPLELQARLLRVLDERQVTPLGTEETHAVDFQLISASHQHLPSLNVLAHAPAATILPAVTVPPLAPAADDDTEAPPPIKLNPIHANERQVLLQLLEQHRWNVSNVAKALDVSRNTLYRKLHKLHIEVSHPE